jgi:hypothetical protein
LDAHLREVIEMTRKVRNDPTLGKTGRPKGPNVGAKKPSGMSDRSFAAWARHIQSWGIKPRKIRENQARNYTPDKMKHTYEVFGQENK